MNLVTPIVYKPFKNIPHPIDSPEKSFVNNVLISFQSHPDHETTHIHTVLKVQPTSMTPEPLLQQPPRLPALTRTYRKNGGASK